MRPCRFAGPGERDQTPFARPEILHFDGIADREDVRVARAHVFVHADAAAFADGEAGGLGERGVGLHANRENHDVGREGFAGTRLDFKAAAFQLLESDHAIIRDDLHAMLLDVALHEARDLRVQRAEHMVGLLNQGHVEADMNQVLRRFEPDESAADHHGPPHGFTIWMPE